MIAARTHETSEAGPASVEAMAAAQEPHADPMIGPGETKSRPQNPTSRRRCGPAPLLSGASGRAHDPSQYSGLPTSRRSLLRVADGVGGHATAKAGLGERGPSPPGRAHLTLVCRDRRLPLRCHDPAGNSRVSSTQA